MPGGGLALLRTIDAIAAEEEKCNGDGRTGLQILRRALEAQARQIAENSAVDGGVVVVASVLLLTEATMTERPEKHEAHAIHQPEM